jgi:hypothetical protein
MQMEKTPQRRHKKLAIFSTMPYIGLGTTQKGAKHLWQK